MKNTVLITGAAGFIGYHVSKRLLEENYSVIGYDNLNNYYSVDLKVARIEELRKTDRFVFKKGSLEDYRTLEELFEKYKPEIVINLAAQAGVRYSIENPRAYIDSNIVGFFNILQCCREYPIEHLIYASSSSVYGGNTKVPYSVDDKVDMPVSLYAATKKADELMAYSYCKLFNIKATGLRFFTVYGPFGRPDMAYYSFADKIMNDKEIEVFNNGDMLRDFTYIDDIVEGVFRLMHKIPIEDDNGARHKIYNIGNNKPVSLLDFIGTLEKCLGKEAKKKYLPMQPGDVYQTYANIDDLKNDIGFQPKVDIEEGLEKFVSWYKSYNNIK